MTAGSWPSPGSATTPRLGVKDAYLLIRRGDVQTAVRFSDAIDDDRLHQNVNGYRLDVVEPFGNCT